MIGNKLFKNYFNRYDNNDVLHDGFIQSMNFSAYTDLTMLNDLSSVIVDSYLYNELKNRIMLSRWKKYLTWDETKKDFIIDPAFYNEAVIALYVYLAKSQKFFDILSANFSSLSAQELEQINHGSRSTGRVYGEQLQTNVYDNVVVELSRGTETENRGTHTDTKTRGTHTDTETHGAFTDTETHATYTDTENVGQHTDTVTDAQHTDVETLGQHSDTETHATYTDTDNIGTHTDTENRGQQLNTNVKVESVYPFDASAFVNDTKSDETTTNGTQQNSTAYGAQINSTQHGERGITKGFGSQENRKQFAEQQKTTGYGAQTNSTQYGQQQITNVNGAQETTNVYGAQSDSDVYGAQENTRSYGKTTNETKTHTDTQRKGAHTDNETVSAFIDTKTKTKIILLSPDKYFEIQKELAEKNIYTLFSEAIDACFLNDNFEFQALEKWGCII